MSLEVSITNTEFDAGSANIYVDIEITSTYSESYLFRYNATLTATNTGLYDQERFFGPYEPDSPDVDNIISAGETITKEITFDATGYEDGDEPGINIVLEDSDGGPYEVASQDFTTIELGEPPNLSVEITDILLDYETDLATATYEITNSSGGSGDYWLDASMAPQGFDVFDTSRSIEGYIQGNQTVTEEANFDISNAEQNDTAGFTAIISLGTEDDSTFQEQDQVLDVSLDPKGDVSLSVDITDITLDFDAFEADVTHQIENTGSDSGEYWLDASMVPDTGANISDQQQDIESTISGDSTATENVTFSISGAESGDTATFTAIVSIGTEGDSDFQEQDQVIDVDISPPSDGGGGTEDPVDGGDDGDGGDGGDTGGGGTTDGDVTVTCQSPSDPVTSGSQFQIPIVLDNSGSEDATVDATVLIGGVEQDSATDLFVPAGGQETYTRFVSAPTVSTGSQEYDVEVEISVN